MDIKKIQSTTKVYSTKFNTITAGSELQQAIQISGDKDFGCKHIRIFTPDYTKNIFVEIQDITSNNNWQNTPFHITAISRENVVIPFRRMIKKNSEITIKIKNNDVASVDVQLSLIGQEY